MSWLAAIIVTGFGLFLFGLAAMVFAKPALAERFFLSFASSARAHYVEQAFRLLIGASLVILSPLMRQPGLFRLLGWAIVVTSAGLCLTPWQWHHRFGKRALPLVVRYMKLFAGGLFAFGTLLLYSVFSGFIDGIA